MKILTLSTYPIAMPRHGGQHRLRNIVDAYKAAGHQTQSIGVLGSITYPSEQGFLPSPTGSEMARHIANPFLMEDWAIGKIASVDDHFFSSLCAQIVEIPDLIHVEQPWLFAFAQRYVAERAGKPVKLLYGSQNIEHVLKRRIVGTYLGKSSAEECERLVLQCELEAVDGADMIGAVSTDDAAWLQKHTSCEVFVAANGVRDRPTTQEGIREANLVKGHFKNALYCASAHPPNVVGFFEMFGRGVGCLSPDQRLVVAGSAGPNIKSDARFSRAPGLAKHYLDVGEVSEECLQGLLHTAHVIVLPITQGGGTNLKTAEALWAGRRVVATPIAMRGFEHFEASPGVTVCAEALDFRHAIRAAMAEPPLELTNEDHLARRSLLWESTLMPLVNHVSGSLC